ncbi:MAG TPA: 4-hydroxy-3-methylbut-2-enyl diphosphate reductase, partial [Chitinophagaceae bacterium]|nr:4-hydroxy-3-methylbut-2-enyl diphosphate reductase [Chitinophagaceae bacterium]
MKKFDVPIIYRSPLISAIKKKRKEWDKTENNASQQGRDFAPTMLDFGPVQIYLARYFGFCYGVENAIEIAFKTVAENKGKKIYLLSEMIHNPQVNADLQAHGIQFLQDTYGKQLIPFSAIQQDDIVLIPAFGTTLLIEEKLKQKGIQTEKYNTTCPFVEKVWNRSEAIAKKNYTIVIHGKPRHEETRATFSHAANNAPSVVVKNMDEAKALAQYITGQKDETAFLEEFKNQHSIGFDIHKDLKRIGVVNQTTMLASHTQAIADYLKQVMLNTFPNDSPEEHFADTRDTLCYATNDNQTAVSNMLNTDAHLA